MAEIKRKTAKKLLVNDILTATYIKRPGWEPSGILTKYGEINRINIMGVVVSLSSEENNTSFLLDDGSANILVRMFEITPEIKKISLGDLITVIGRPREYGNSKYIVPEIVRKIENKKWYDVYHLEVKLQKKTNSLKLPVESEDDSVKETGPYQKVLNTLAILDKGSGVDVQEIIKNINVKNCETIIQNLIEEGEVFEISPGRIKLLE